MPTTEHDDDQTDDEAQDDLDPDQSTDSTDDRWFRYKRAELAAGREPKTWGGWLAAGQPCPVD